jgi:hypothetical protein
LDPSQSRQPPFSTLARRRGPSRGHSALAMIGAKKSDRRFLLQRGSHLGFDGRKNLERVGDQQDFPPHRAPIIAMKSQQMGGGLGDRDSEWRAGLSAWGFAVTRRKRSGFRDAPIAQHPAPPCNPSLDTAPASSTLRDNNFRELAGPEHRPHA